MKRKAVKMVTIKNCMECPHVTVEYAGQGNHSYFCGKTRRVQNCIAYNCENRTEEPQNHKFPHWCPLEEK